MRRDDLRHGTNAGWTAHMREGKRPCSACRVAHNEYMRGYRSDPKNRKRVRADNSARTRALWRLAKNHRKEFLTLVEEERA